MSNQESKQYLLEEENLNFQHQAQPQFKRVWFQRDRCLIAACVCAMGLSLLLNLYFMFKKPSRQLEGNLSKYAGLPSDVPYTYQFHTDYWGENETLADEMWENISVDPVAVALSSSYVKEHQLEPSTPYPWNPDKSIYFLKVYHSLHCLKIIRKAFKDILAKQENSIETHHVWHCLDSIRQDLMCRVDDTPMPIPPGQGNVVGNSQIMMCRDLNKLREWSQNLERNACYREVSDYRPVAHSLERHAFCPDDSEDYPVMKAYFDLHGHKPMFAD